MILLHSFWEVFMRSIFKISSKVPQLTEGYSKKKVPWGGMKGKLFYMPFLRYIFFLGPPSTTLFFKRNAAWKVAFLFGKSVDR